jgi:hypothetical protein
MPFNKLATLRDLCLNIGLVLVKQDYDIVTKTEQNAKLPFDIHSIQEVLPVVKHIDLDSEEARRLVARG